MGWDSEHLDNSLDSDSNVVPNSGKKRKKCCALDPLAVEEMTAFFSLYFNKHAPDEWMLVKALYTMVS